MKIKTKETVLSDGSKVYDVNIYPNGGTLMNRKVIISCTSEKDCAGFLRELVLLFEKYTIETID